MATDFYWVYITAGSRDEAKEIGRSLLENRLAACINLFENVTSMYWWEGRIQQDAEVVMVAKTPKSNFEALKQQVLKVHSYDCPCIAALETGPGHQAYLDWLSSECGGNKPQFSK